MIGKNHQYNIDAMRGTIEANGGMAILPKQESGKGTEEGARKSFVKSFDPGL